MSRKRVRTSDFGPVLRNSFRIGARQGLFFAVVKAAMPLSRTDKCKKSFRGLLREKCSYLFYQLGIGFENPFLREDRMSDSVIYRSKV